MPTEKINGLNIKDFTKNLKTLVTTTINNDKLISKAFALLADYQNIEICKEELRNECAVIEEKFINLEHATDGESLSDGERLKEIKPQLEQLEKASKQVANLVCNCAEFLIMNDDDQKLKALFAFNYSPAVKNEINFKIAKKLVNKGNIKKIISLTKMLDLQKVSNDKDSLLHIAAISGQIDIFKYLLTIIDDKNMINHKDGNGETPLECALQYAAQSFINFGQFDNELAEFLINQPKIDLHVIINNKLWKRLNFRSKNDDQVKNWNILHITTLFGNLEMVKLLLTKLGDSALINAMGEHIGTPLQSAIVGASVDRTGLPPAGMNWVQPFSYFETMLNIYSYNTSIDDDKRKILVENYNHIAKKLLSILSSHQINSEDNEGDGPFNDCVLRSNVELLKFLLTKEVDVNHQNYKKFTVLHQAVLYSKFEIIEELLKLPNIDLTLRNDEELTAYQLLNQQNRRNDKAKIIALFEDYAKEKGIVLDPIKELTTITAEDYGVDEIDSNRVETIGDDTNDYSDEEYISDIEDSYDVNLAQIPSWMFTEATIQESNNHSPNSSRVDTSDEVSRIVLGG